MGGWRESECRFRYGEMQVPEPQNICVLGTGVDETFEGRRCIWYIRHTAQSRLRGMGENGGERRMGLCLFLREKDVFCV